MRAYDLTVRIRRTMLLGSLGVWTLRHHPHRVWKQWLPMLASLFFPALIFQHVILQHLYISAIGLSLLLIPAASIAHRDLSNSLSMEMANKLPEVKCGEFTFTPIHRVDSSRIQASIDDTVRVAMGWSPSASNGAEPVTWSQCLGYVAHIEDEIVGVVTLDNLEPRTLSTTMGWWMTSTWRGRGAGRAVVQTSLEHVRTVGIRTVVIGTAVTNTPVQKVVEALGATRHVQRTHVLPNGTMIDSYWYSWELV